MKNFLFLTVLLCATAFSNLQAQSASNEADMQTFARKFMAAYNQGDHTALQKMYMADAVRIDQTGKEIKGADNIAAYFADQFRLNNATLLLKQMEVVWSDYQHAFLSKGTYEVYGTTNVYDIKVHATGAYENTMLKQNGEWKIAKSVLSPLVKTLVYHQVKDFTEWKWGFEAALPMRLAAGERGSEYGTLNGDPNTVYVISEWTSVEAAQSFFANPELEKAMQAAGVTEKPTIMIFDRK